METKQKQIKYIFCPVLFVSTLQIVFHTNLWRIGSVVVAAFSSIFRRPHGKNVIHIQMKQFSPILLMAIFIDSAQAIFQNIRHLFNGDQQCTEHIK